MKDYSRTAIASRIAEQLASNPECFRIWVKDHHLNAKEIGAAIAQAAITAAEAIGQPPRFEKYQ